MSSLASLWERIDGFWLFLLVVTVVPLTWVKAKLMRARRAIRERVAHAGGVLLDQADRERENAPDDRGIFAILFTYRDRHGDAQSELCELQFWGPPRFREPDPGDR